MGMHAVWGQREEARRADGGGWGSWGGGQPAPAAPAAYKNLAFYSSYINAPASKSDVFSALRSHRTDTFVTLTNNEQYQKFIFSPLAFVTVYTTIYSYTTILRIDLISWWMQTRAEDFASIVFALYKHVPNTLNIYTVNFILVCV